MRTEVVGGEGGSGESCFRFSLHVFLRGGLDQVNSLCAGFFALLFSPPPHEERNRERDGKKKERSVGLVLLCVCVCVFCLWLCVRAHTHAHARTHTHTHTHTLVCVTHTHMHISRVQAQSVFLKNVCLFVCLFPFIFSFFESGVVEAGEGILCFWGCWYFFFTSVFFLFLVAPPLTSPSFTLLPPVCILLFYLLTISHQRPPGQPATHNPSARQDVCVVCVWPVKGDTLGGKPWQG